MNRSSTNDSGYEILMRLLGIALLSPFILIAYFYEQYKGIQDVYTIRWSDIKEFIIHG